MPENTVELIKDSELLFSEKQRFTQPWLWALLIGINGLFLFGLVQQIFIGKPFGDWPMPDAGLLAVAILFIIFTIGFLCLRLETRIQQDGIYVRFFPFQAAFSFYAWDTIEQSFVRKYKPIAEFGGWGLRGFGKNRALNISGNQGIQLVMTDGSKLLIGTGKATQAREVLKQSGHLKGGVII